MCDHKTVDHLDACHSAIAFHDWVRIRWRHRDVGLHESLIRLDFFVVPISSTFEFRTVGPRIIAMEGLQWEVNDVNGHDCEARALRHARGAMDRTAINLHAVILRDHSQCD